MKNEASLLQGKLYLLRRKLSKFQSFAINGDKKMHSTPHFVLQKKVQDGGVAGSGVARGQVEATKYVVFRYVAASFFTRNVGNFHGKHSVSQGFCTIWITLT